MSHHPGLLAGLHLLVLVNGQVLGADTVSSARANQVIQIRHELCIASAKMMIKSKIIRLR